MQTPPNEEIKNHLYGFLSEAEELRRVTLPGLNAPPEEFRKAVLTVRANLDRLEELLCRTIQAYAHARSMAARHAEAAQERWDGAATTRGARSGDDYEGAKERYARWNLQTLDSRRLAADSAQHEMFCKSAEDRLRVMYRGLDGVRMDLHRILASFAWESTVDR